MLSHIIGFVCRVMSAQDRIREIKYCLGSNVKSQTDKLIICSDISGEQVVPAQEPTIFVGSATGSYVDTAPFSSNVTASSE